MSLWFEIAVVVLLGLIVIELFAIEGNIGRDANAIHQFKSKFPN
jgi:hypothetical protein